MKKIKFISILLLILVVLSNILLIAKNRVLTKDIEQVQSYHDLAQSIINNLSEKINFEMTLNEKKISDTLTLRKSNGELFKINEIVKKPTLVVKLGQTSCDCNDQKFLNRLGNGGFFNIKKGRVIYIGLNPNRFFSKDKTLVFEQNSLGLSSSIKDKYFLFILDSTLLIKSPCLINSEDSVYLKKYLSTIIRKLE